MIKEYGWHEWLCKTNFSFLLGASHPKDLVLSARELDYQSLCINDFDGVYGLARTHLENKRAEKAAPKNFKVHYSAEIHLAKDHHLPVLLQHTLVLVALSPVGYRNLCRLINQSHKESKSEAFLSCEGLLSSSVEGLAAIQPMRGLIRRSEESLDLLKLKEHFSDRLYLALSRHLHPAEDLWIPQTLELAKSYELKTLFSQDAFFHHSRQKPLSDLLHSIRTNQTLENCQEHFFPNAERRLHSLHELERLYTDIPSFENSLKFSRELAESIDFSFDQLRYRYPSMMIPESHSAQSFLEELVWQGARERFGEVIPEKLCKNLHHEISLIRQLEFADYFLTVWDIVRWAREQGILCQGRGSAANSSVCFVLGITSVDPTQFDLLFERFISMERGDPPDIDVDFEHERREEVVQYIYQRYGRARAAMVANVVTFRGRGATRAVGKALGIPEQVLSQVSNWMGTKFFRSHAVEHILDASKFELKKQKESTELSERLPWKLWGELTQELRGFPRHLSIHSGGFVISDQPLDELMAQEPATMDSRTVVQWCKEDIEGLGFFKIDVLCLGMLSAMRKCFDMVKRHYGKDLTLYNLPPDDPKTYEMIQKADTVGTFQIESRAQMSMLPRLRPKKFYDLVIEVAIIRPGPIQGGVIHPFLKRRDGIEQVTYPDPRLEPILRRTMGIPIFQEQAMRIAIAVGDFTPGEANELRRNIGAWGLTFDRNLNPWLEKLERGMRKNGIEEKFIEIIRNQMKGFSDYGFPESHAVSFALIAYASSYMKCHYPAAFFASVLNSEPMGFYPTHALLQAARLDGVSILPVCINSSDWDYSLELISEGKKEYGIRLGLRTVNGLNQKVAEALLTRRQELGSFKSLDHFLENNQLYRPDLTALAAANAFHTFNLQRREALWFAEKTPLKPLIDIYEKKLNWRAESPYQKIQADYASFNTSLGTHPAQVIKNEYWNYHPPLKAVLSSGKFGKVKGGRRVLTFGMVMVKQAPPSAKGMVFLTLVDEDGFINLAFTPQVYKKHYKLVEKEAFLCVLGKMQRANEGHSILVEKVYSREHAAILPIANRNKWQNKSAQKAPDLLKRPRSYH